MTKTKYPNSSVNKKNGSKRHEIYKIVKGTYANTNLNVLSPATGGDRGCRQRVNLPSQNREHTSYDRILPVGLKELRNKRRCWLRKFR